MPVLIEYKIPCTKFQILKIFSPILNQLDKNASSRTKKKQTHRNKSPQTVCRKDKVAAFLDRLIPSDFITSVPAPQGAQGPFGKRGRPQTKS